MPKDNPNGDDVSNHRRGKSMEGVTVSRINMNSIDGERILKSMRRTNFDEKFLDRYWRVEQIELVANNRLEKQYYTLKNELRTLGRKTEDLEDIFVFSAETEKACREICREGHKVGLKKRHVLGYTGSGVHVVRNFDILSRYIAYQQFASPAHIVIFKAFLGKAKPIVPRLHKEDNYVSAWSGFDCHISARKIEPTMTICEALNCSYVYFYEYDDISSNTVKYPRQLLPHAVIQLVRKYTIGAETPFLAVGRHDRYSNVEVQGETRRGFRFSYPKPNRKQSQLVSRQRKTKEFMKSSLQSQLLEMRTKGDSRPISVLPSVNGLSDSEVANKTIKGKTTTNYIECDSTNIRFNGIKYCVSPTREIPYFRKPEVNGDVCASFTTFKNQSNTIKFNRDVPKLPLSMKPFVRLKRLKKDTILRLSRKHKRPETDISSQELSLKAAKENAKTGSGCSDRNQEFTKSETNNENSMSSDNGIESDSVNKEGGMINTVLLENERQIETIDKRNGSTNVKCQVTSANDSKVTVTAGKTTDIEHNPNKPKELLGSLSERKSHNIDTIDLLAKVKEIQCSAKKKSEDSDKDSGMKHKRTLENKRGDRVTQMHGRSTNEIVKENPLEDPSKRKTSPKADISNTKVLASPLNIMGKHEDDKYPDTESKPPYPSDILHQRIQACKDMAKSSYKHLSVNKSAQDELNKPPQSQNSSNFATNYKGGVVSKPSGSASIHEKYSWTIAELEKFNVLLKPDCKKVRSTVRAHVKGIHGKDADLVEKETVQNPKDPTKIDVKHSEKVKSSKETFNYAQAKHNSVVESAPRNLQSIHSRVQGTISNQSSPLLSDTSSSKSKTKSKQIDEPSSNDFKLVAPTCNRVPPPRKIRKDKASGSSKDKVEESHRFDCVQKPTTIKDLFKEPLHKKLAEKIRAKQILKGSSHKFGTSIPLMESKTAVSPPAGVIAPELLDRSPKVASANMTGSKIFDIPSQSTSKPSNPFDAAYTSLSTQYTPHPNIPLETQNSILPVSRHESSIHPYKDPRSLSNITPYSLGLSIDSSYNGTIHSNKFASISKSQTDKSVNVDRSHVSSGAKDRALQSNLGDIKQNASDPRSELNPDAAYCPKPSRYQPLPDPVIQIQKEVETCTESGKTSFRHFPTKVDSNVKGSQKSGSYKNGTINIGSVDQNMGAGRKCHKKDNVNNGTNSFPTREMVTSCFSEKPRHNTRDPRLKDRRGADLKPELERKSIGAVVSTFDSKLTNSGNINVAEEGKALNLSKDTNGVRDLGGTLSSDADKASPPSINRPNFTIDANTAQRLQRVLRKHISEVQKNAALTGQSLPSSFETKYHERSKKTPCQDNVGVPQANKLTHNIQSFGHEADFGSQKNIKADSRNKHDDMCTSQADIDTGRLETVQVKSKETSQTNPSQANVGFPSTSKVTLDGLKYTSKTDFGSQDNTKTETKVTQDKIFTMKTANPNDTDNKMYIQKDGKSSDGATLKGCIEREVSIEHFDNDSQDTVIGGIELSPARLQCLSESLQSVFKEQNTDTDEINGIDAMPPVDYQIENASSEKVTKSSALFDRDYKKENPSVDFTPLSENDSPKCAWLDGHNISIAQSLTNLSTSPDCFHFDINVEGNHQSFEKREGKSNSHLVKENSIDEIANGKEKVFLQNEDETILPTLNDFEKEDYKIGDHIDIKDESIPCVSKSPTKDVDHSESPMITEFKLELNGENTETGQDNCYAPMVQTSERANKSDTFRIEGKYIGSSWAEVCQGIINKEIIATESQENSNEDKSQITQHQPSTIFGQIHRLRNGSTIRRQKKLPETSRNEIIDTLRSLSTALQALSEPHLEKKHEYTSTTVDNADDTEPSEKPPTDTKPVVEGGQNTNHSGKHSVIQDVPLVHCNSNDTHSVNVQSELIPLVKIKTEPETEIMSHFVPAEELIDQPLENNSTSIDVACNKENGVGLITSIKEEPVLDVTSYQSLHLTHEQTHGNKQTLGDGSIQQGDIDQISDCGYDKDETKAMPDTNIDDNVLPILFDVNNEPCIHPLEPLGSIPTLSRVESEPIRIKCDPETENVNIPPSCNESETSKENTKQVNPVFSSKPKSSLRESIKHVRALRAKAGMLNKGMNERKNIFDTKVSIQKMRRKLAMPLSKDGKIEVNAVNSVANSTTVKRNTNNEFNTTRSTMPKNNNTCNQSSENDRVTSSVETPNDLNKHESTHALNHDNVTGYMGNNDTNEESTEGFNETSDADASTIQTKDKSPSGEGDQIVTSSSTPSHDGPKSQKSNKGKKRDIIPFETVMRKKKEQYLKYKRGLTSQKFIDYNEFKHELRRGLVPPAYLKFQNHGSDGRALYNFGMYRSNYFRKNTYHHNKHQTYSPEKQEDFSRSEQRPVISERGTMLYEESREDSDCVSEHELDTHLESSVERDKPTQEDSLAHRMQSDANIKSHSKEPPVSHSKVRDTVRSAKERTNHTSSTDNPRNKSLSQTNSYTRNPHSKSNNVPAYEHHKTFSTFSAGTFRKLPFNSGKSGYFSWRKKYQAPVKTVRIGNEKMYVTRRGAIQTEEEHMEWKMFKERERIRVQIEQAVKEYRRTFENTGDDFVGDGKVSQYLQTLSEKLEHIQSKRDILTKPYVPKPKHKPRDDTMVEATDIQPKEEPVEAQRLRSVDRFRDQFERSLNVTKQKRNEDTLVDALWTDPEEKSKQSDMIEKMLREHVFKHFENVAEKLKADLTAKLASTAQTIERTANKSFDKDSDRYNTISKEVEKQLETIRNMTSQNQTDQSRFQRNTPMPQEWNPDRDLSRTGGSRNLRFSPNRHVTSKSRSPEPIHSRLPPNQYNNSRSRSGSNDRYRPRKDLVRNQDPVTHNNKSDYMNESRSRSRSVSPRRPSSLEYQKYHYGGRKNDQQPCHRYSSTWNSQSRSRSPDMIQRRSRSGSNRDSRSKSRSPDVAQNIFNVESRYDSRSRSRSRERQYHATNSGPKHDSRQKSPPPRRPQNRFTAGSKYYSRHNSRSPNQISCSETPAVTENRSRSGTNYHSTSRSPFRVRDRSMSPEYREWSTSFSQSKRRYGDNYSTHKRRSRSRSASKDSIPLRKKSRVERPHEMTQLDNNRARPNAGSDPKVNEIDFRNIFEKYYKAVVKSKWDDDPINDEALNDNDILTDAGQRIDKSGSSENRNKSADSSEIDRDIVNISSGANELEIEQDAGHQSRNPVRHRSSRNDKDPQETDYLSDDSPIDIDHYINREEQDIRKSGGSREQYSSRDTGARGWNNNRASHSRGWNKITQFRGRNFFHKMESRGRGWFNRTNDRGRGLYNKAGGRGWYNQTNGRGRSWYKNRDSRGRGWYDRTERYGRNDFRFKPDDGDDNIHNRASIRDGSKQKHHDTTDWNRQRADDDYDDKRNDDYQFDDRGGMSNASKGSGYRHHDRFSRRDIYEESSAYDDGVEVIEERNARDSRDDDNAFPADERPDSSNLKSTKHSYNQAHISSNLQSQSQSPRPIPTICHR